MLFSMKLVMAISITSPLDMKYEELEILLDKFFKKEDLPNSFTYYNSIKKKPRFNYLKFLVKLLLINLEWFIFYNSYIKKQFGEFKKSIIFKNFFDQSAFLRMILPEILKQKNGKLDREILIHFFIATKLYDATCDIPQFRQYLRDFDSYIMFDKPIYPRDNFLITFKNSLEYLKDNLDDNQFKTLKNYIKIGHSGQVIGISQMNDKPVNRVQLSKTTLARGGIPLLSICFLFIPNLSKNEKKAIFEFGGVMQIIDDTMDIEADLQSGVKTLPNQKMINNEELEKLYNGVVQNLIKTLNLDINHLNSFFYGYKMIQDNIIPRL